MPRRLLSRNIGAFLLGAFCFALFTTAAYAQSAETLRERINRGTVSIISGGVDGTYVRIASDLSSVLDNGSDLRVLPIIGKGSVQNIADVLYLRGIDIGIVQSDVLAYIKAENIHPGIERRIHYVTKLYNEEIHLLARGDIQSIEDLTDKEVNFGVQGSGTYMTSTILFDALDVPVKAVSFDQALALQKVKDGEIAAMVYVAGKPARLFKDMKSTDNVKFLSLPYSDSLLETYLPSQLSNADYPNVVRSGETVDTLAVGAVMAVYNWKKDSDRYQKVARFVENFFTNFERFQQTPRHPKWREVSLSAEVPGWTRFTPAEKWLNRAVAASDTQLRTAFEVFLAEETERLTGRGLSSIEKDDLFRRFVDWQTGQAN